MIRKNIFFIFSFLFVLLSCSTDSEYSTHTVYFVFDNSTHQNSVLASAMTPGSSVFASVVRDGNYIDFTSNTGQTVRSTLTAVDLRRSIVMGQNNGIIIGYSMLDTPATFYVYDRECPNCFDFNAYPLRSYPLTLISGGIATCSNCRRSYNLYTNGIVSAGDNGNSLTRYRGSTTGAYGILQVN